MGFNVDEFDYLERTLSPSSEVVEVEVEVADCNGKKASTKPNGKGKGKESEEGKGQTKGVIQSNGSIKKASKEREEEERLKHEEEEGWEVIRRAKRSSSSSRSSWMPNKGNQNNGWRVDTVNRSHPSRQGQGQGRREDDNMNERVKAIFEKASLKLAEQRLQRQINAPKPVSNEQPKTASTDNGNQVKPPSKDQQRGTVKTSYSGQQPRPRENGNRSDQLKPVSKDQQYTKMAPRH